MSKRTRGNIGEDAAAEFLERNGYKILKRNYAVHGGEIDIIAKKDDILAFVEVKTRSDGFIADGESAVDIRKKRLIMKTAGIFYDAYSKAHGEAFCRFDVVSVVVENEKIITAKYYPGAFDNSDV